MARSKPIKIPIKVLDEATKDIRRIKESLSSVGKPVRDINNQFKSMKRELRSIQSLGRKVGKSFKKVGKNMTVGVSVPTALLGAGIIRASADFEKSMNRVEAKLGNKATANGLIELNNLAKQLGSETQFSAKEAADGMAFLAQAGWNTNQILKGTPGLLNLAAAAEMDLAQAADITSNVMGAFKLEAKEAGRVADIFASATSGANIDMEMLGETMKFVAPIAHKSGKSLEETTAVIGLLGNIGIQGSLAGTAMKNALLNLASPAAKGSKLLRRLGIEVADAEGNMLSMSDVMSNVGKGLNGLTQQQQLKVLNEIFGKRAISGASELVDQALVLGKDGKNNIQRFTESLKEQGSAEKMRKTMMKGAAGAMIELKSATEGLAIAVGESGLISWFTDIVKSLTSFVRSLSQSNPQLLRWGVIIAGLVATLGPLLAAIGFMISGLTGLLPVLAILGSAMKVLTVISWAAMLPFIKFIAIAAVIGGAIWLLKRGWDAFGDTIKEWGSAAMHHLTTVFNFMKEMLAYTPIGLLFKGISKLTGLGQSGQSSDSNVDARSTSVARETIILKQQQKNVNASIDFSNVIPGTKVSADGFDKQSIEFNRGLMMDGVGI